MFWRYFMTKTYQKYKNKRISQHFRSSEFDCKGYKCCVYTKINMRLVKKLEKLRKILGFALIINSGFRCETHNKNVGGAKYSKHRYGLAADIHIPKEKNIDEIAKIAKKLGFRGIGKYDTFIHLDVRKRIGVAEWDLRKKK